MKRNVIKSITENKKKIFKITFIVICVIGISPIAFFGGWIVVNQIRPAPEWTYDPILELDHWTVVEASKDPKYQHNSNTDMIFYDGFFYLIYQQSKWHLQDTNGSLVVAKSPDASVGSWEELARIQIPGTDVRDPKFANINGRLFVYFLPNDYFDPGPTTTYYCYSDDGFETFTTPEEMKVNVEHQYSNGTIASDLTPGWCFWRPKTQDDITWYVIAFGKEYQGLGVELDYPITALLSSNDGLNWTEVSKVYSGAGNGEPCLEFLPSGEFIATLRVTSMGIPGYALGNPQGNTMICTSYNSFQNWSYAPDFQTRLDGATLFSINGRIFGVGRNHMGPAKDLGNHFKPKRTSFYEIKSDKLIHLFDLPSTGDTAYTGVVIKDGWIYTSYYTNPIHKEFAWFIGLAFRPESEIRIARVSVSGLLAFADIIGSE